MLQLVFLVDDEWSVGCGVIIADSKCYAGDFALIS